MASLDDVVRELRALRGDVKALAAAVGKGGGGGGGGSASEKSSAPAGGGALGLAKGAAGIAAAAATGKVATDILNAGVSSAYTGGGSLAAIQGGVLRSVLGAVSNLPGGGLANELTKPIDRAQASLSARASNRALLGAQPFTEEQARGQFGLELAAQKRAVAAERQISGIANEEFKKKTQSEVGTAGVVLEVAANLGIFGEEIKDVVAGLRSFKATLGQY